MSDRLPPSAPLPSRMQGDDDETSAEVRGPAVSDEVREQILNEYREQELIEEFQLQRPDLWLQVQRLSMVMELQGTLEENIFQRGTCFVHVNLPGVDEFCLRQVQEIDLETCLARLDIYDSQDLVEGIVCIPIEAISWFGFPGREVQPTFQFKGFNTRQ